MLSRPKVPPWRVPYPPTALLFSFTAMHRIWGPLKTDGEDHAFLITLSAPGGGDVFNGGLGNDTLIGGPSFDRAIFSGDRTDYVITPSGTEVTVSGPDGNDATDEIELLVFDDTAIGVSIDLAVENPDLFMFAIRDFDGNDLGGADGWLRIGATDVQIDGDLEHIFVNRDIGALGHIGPDHRRAN